MERGGVACGVVRIVPLREGLPLAFRFRTLRTALNGTGVRTVTNPRLARPVVVAVPAFRAFLCSGRNGVREIIRHKKCTQIVVDSGFLYYLWIAIRR